MSSIIYITNTRKSYNCQSVQEITDYKYYILTNPTKTSYSTTKKKFCDDLYSQGNVFTENSNGDRAECELKISSNYEKFLQTKGNGTITDNLLSLPNF